MHCRKVAGSSIAAALSPYLGDEDLHLGTWPEALGMGVLPNRRARRDLFHPAAALSYASRLLRAPLKAGRIEYRVAALNGAQRLKYRRHLGHSPEHAYARDVRRFQPEAWRDYFTFCFVRNPFERAVSDYQWRTSKRGTPEMTFLDFLERLQQREFSHPAIPHHFDNWPIYTIDDAIAVDFVGRFETLYSDLNQIFDRVGLDSPQLPNAKGSATRSRNYRDAYRAREKALVQNLFGKEIEEFSYVF